MDFTSHKFIVRVGTHRLISENEPWDAHAALYSWHGPIQLALAWRRHRCYRCRCCHTYCAWPPPSRRGQRHPCRCRSSSWPHWNGQLTKKLLPGNGCFDCRSIFCCSALLPGQHALHARRPATATAPGVRGRAIESWPPRAQLPLAAWGREAL